MIDLRFMDRVLKILNRQGVKTRFEDQWEWLFKDDGHLTGRQTGLIQLNMIYLRLMYRVSK